MIYAIGSNTVEMRIFIKSVNSVPWSREDGRDASVRMERILSHAYYDSLGFALTV